MKPQRPSNNATMTTTKRSGLQKQLLPLLLAVLLLVSYISVYLSHHLPDPRLGPVHAALRSFSQSQTQQQHYYPLEDPIPNPPVPDGHNTFAQCLLVMDDNHRLIEWMAYHYHVLPLRYMIVTVDPRSQTSPEWIWNRYRQLGVYIETWHDSDFWRSSSKPIPANATLQLKRDRHRGRQKFFYRQCLIALKKANRTWVALHDSDEYLLYNHKGGDGYADWEAKMQARHEQSQLHGHKKRLKPSQTPPTTAAQGALIQYIRQEQEAGLDYYQSPCLGVPRLMFGAAPSTDAELHRQVPPNYWNRLDHLDTLFYRHHAPRNDFVKNALGKVLIDVSRVDMEHTPPFMSLHRPIKKLCSAPWHDDWESGLRINHYLGSWESYSFRDDSRRGFERSLEQWEYKASTNGALTDDNIRPWLQGLVESEGATNAAHMLEGAGLPDHYVPQHSKEEWTLLPDKLAKILSVNETVANDNRQVAFDAWVRQKYAQKKDGLWSLF